MTIPNLPRKWQYGLVQSMSTNSIDCVVVVELLRGERLGRAHAHVACIVNSDID